MPIPGATYWVLSVAQPGPTLDLPLSMGIWKCESRHWLSLQMGKECALCSQPSEAPLFLSPTGTDMAVFCLLCGKRFQAQSALQQHMEVHAGVRSYICSECNRTFPSHTALKRHLRSHTGRSVKLMGGWGVWEPVSIFTSKDVKWRWWAESALSPSAQGLDMQGLPGMQVNVDSSPSPLLRTVGSESFHVQHRMLIKTAGSWVPLSETFIPWGQGGFPDAALLIHIPKGFSCR